MNYLSDNDTLTHRVCGTCLAKKRVEDFYKDGKDSEDNTRYRRDCKECYREARIKDAVLKSKTSTSSTSMKVK